MRPKADAMEEDALGLVLDKAADHTGGVEWLQITCGWFARCIA